MLFYFSSTLNGKLGSRSMLRSITILPLTYDRNDTNSNHPHFLLMPLLEYRRSATLFTLFSLPASDSVRYERKKTETVRPLDNERLFSFPRLHSFPYHTIIFLTISCSSFVPLLLRISTQFLQLSASRVSIRFQLSLPIPLLSVLRLPYNTGLIPTEL